MNHGLLPPAPHLLVVREVLSVYRLPKPAEPSPLAVTGSENKAVILPPYRSIVLMQRRYCSQDVMSVSCREEDLVVDRYEKTKRKTAHRDGSPFRFDNFSIQISGESTIP